jgi:hypothetical protein
MIIYLCYIKRVIYMLYLNHMLSMLISYLQVDNKTLTSYYLQVDNKTLSSYQIRSWSFFNSIFSI